MTARKQALDIITNITCDTQQAQEIVNALEQQGLLLTNLPQPDEEGRFYVGNRPFWVSWENRPCVEAKGLGGLVAGEGATIPLGEPGECLDVALALIAAHNNEQNTSYTAL